MKFILMLAFTFVNAYKSYSSKDDITAALVGSDIKLTCNHRDHDSVYWEWKSPSDDEFKPINKDSERGASFQNRQTASLKIKSKTKTIGNGGYRCRYYNTGDGSTEKNRRMSNVLWIGKPGVPDIIKKRYYGERNKDITISCSPRSSFPKITQIWWTKLKENKTQNITSNGSKYSKENSANLTIKNFGRDDIGNYVCNVANRFGVSKSMKIKVRRGARPSIHTANQNMSAEIGTSLSLVVNVTTKKTQKATVTWHKDGRPMDKDKNRYSISNSSLFIHNVTQRDTGLYNITATNDVGSSSAEIRVCAWKKPLVRVETDVTYAKVGSNVTVCCTVQSELEIVNISFSTMGRKLARVSKDKKSAYLTLRQVKQQNAGKYICTAAHQYGTGNASVYVRVGHSPDVRIPEEYIKKIGSTVSMTCNVSSTIHSNVTWLFKATNTNVSDHQWKTTVATHIVPEITIPNVNIIHAGYYTCIGNNLYGNEEDKTELIVLSTTILGNSTGIEKNMNVSLRCSATGKSGKGEIVWTKNHEMLNNNQKHILNLVRVKRNDSGNYRCKITYKSETAISKVLRLYVKDIPVVETKDLNVESFTGYNVTLNCTYDEESEPINVEWFRNNNSVHKTVGTSYSGGNLSVPSLTLHRLQLSDSGEYVCSAKNSIGSGFSNVIKLIVKVPGKVQIETSGVIGGIIAGLLLLVAIVIVLLVIRKRKDDQKGTCHKVATDTTDMEYSKAEMQNVHSEKLYANAESLTRGISNHNIVSPTLEFDTIDNGLDSTYYNSLEANSTRVKVTDLKDYLKRKEVGDGIRKEFKDVPYGIIHPTLYAQASENKLKNRYKTTFAYDHTRIVLQTKSSDYINASYIDGVDHKKQYIACQGPLKTTLADHWRMIWQENVRQIIMLTNLVEGIKVKCERYWPECTGEMKTGPFRLTLLTEKERATFVTREINVYNQEASENRRVVQYHFTAWPDHGTPNPLDLVAFYRHVIADEKKRDIPVLVHCSAGIGRTGTYIGLDAMTKQGSETGYIDIFSYLKQMRYCRMNMIQTEDQYVFLHHALLEMFSVKNCNITKDRLGIFWDEIQADRGPTNNQRLFKEFKMLKSLVEHSAGKQAVLTPVDAKKNRNNSVSPLESSRIFLVSYERGRSDYINAVNVPSFRNVRGYQVTQLPLPDTMVDFWTMMIDHGSQTIVLMLENADEANLVYTSDNESVTKGPFVIDVIVREEFGYGIMRAELDVTWKGDEKYHIHVYQVVCKDTIQPKPLCGLVDHVLNVWNKSDLPVTVVSSDGARHCGLFCTFANVVSSMMVDESADVLHLARVVNLQQPQFLSTYDEYKRCYEALNVYFESSNIYANT